MQQALTYDGRTAFPVITGVAIENIGAGIGLVGTILRCHLSYEGDAADMPRSVIVKLHLSLIHI